MPELNIKQSLRQGLYLSARMEQSMRILQATTQELEAYLAELSDVELDEQVLRNVAGGTCITDGTSCWTLN